LYWEECCNAHQSRGTRHATSEIACIPLRPDCKGADRCPCTVPIGKRCSVRLCRSGFASYRPRMPLKSRPFSRIDTRLGVRLNAGESPKRDPESTSRRKCSFVQHSEAQAFPAIAYSGSPIGVHRRHCSKVAVSLTKSYLHGSDQRPWIGEPLHIAREDRTTVIEPVW
jgi:hypothetical protein